MERYASIWLHRVVGLNQNSFFDLSKCYSVGNVFNGIGIQFTLENIFNEKTWIFRSFISRINVVIGKKDISNIKNDISEKQFICKKNIGTR